MSAKITYLGHSVVLIEGSKNIIIDPFLTDNPLASLSVDKLPRIDIVVLTHDHDDHFGDTLAILKNNKAKLIAIHEISLREDIVDTGVEVVGMNIGGTYKDESGVKFSMTPALHTSKNGIPIGFVIDIDGQKIYHAGDTAFFSGMAFIPKIFGDLDIAFLPIGGHYTMDVKQAVMAADSLKPKLVVPIHYNTWPIISQDPNKFISLVSNGKLLNPGESI
jgi:L-ascorbate metabolism protein UlaG (beta-lactamase superfamily)